MLRVRDLYHKVAIFELELRKCSSRTRLVLQCRDFRAGAAEVCFDIYIYIYIYASVVLRMSQLSWQRLWSQGRGGHEHRAGRLSSDLHQLRGIFGRGGEQDPAGAGEDQGQLALALCGGGIGI